MQDNALDNEELRRVAAEINSVVVNKQHPSGDDLGYFTMLMVELHIRKHNLPGVRIEDFKTHVDALNPPSRFSEDAMKDLQCRIDYSHEFVSRLMEKGYSDELDPLLTDLRGL